jgi:hypothetical protein
LLAAGGLSAGIALSSFAAEPGYLAPTEEAAVAPSEEQPTLAEAKVLRWKTSKIGRGSEGASNLGSSAITTIITASHEESAEPSSHGSSGLRPALKAPAAGSNWNKSKAGSPSTLFSDDGAIRLVAHDPHDDPFGDRAVQAGPALAAPAGARKAALNNQPLKPAVPEAEEPDAAEPMPEPKLTKPPAKRSRETR